MKRLTTIGLSLLMGGSAFAIEADSARFHSFFDARSGALGGTDVALPEDQHAVNNNPAGLGRIKSPSIQFSQETMMQDISAKSVLFNTPSRNIGLSAAYRFLDFGTTQRTNVDGEIDGEFEGYDRFALIGFGVPWGKHFSMGLTGKHIDSSIDRYHANAWTGHLGMRIDNLWGNRVSLGLSADNIISMGRYKYETETEKIPKILRGGFWYQTTSKRYNYGLQYNSAGNSESSLGVGMETVIYKSDKLGFMGRVGYNSEKSDTGGTAGYSAGLGFQWNSLRLDWAWVPYDDFGMTQIATLGFLLGPKEAVDGKEGSVSPSIQAPSKITEQTNTQPEPSKLIESFYMKDGKIIKGHVFFEDDKTLAVEAEDRWFQVPRDQIKFRK